MKVFLITSKHEHFIHNSDYFKQNYTNNVMSVTSLIKDLLKLRHRLIANSHLSCHEIKLENFKKIFCF